MGAISRSPSSHARTDARTDFCARSRARARTHTHKRAGGVSQALQRMATDLLGPNNWDRLPPEQLWNVLKVIRHSRRLRAYARARTHVRSTYR
jgi:hypothetical protein